MEISVACRVLLALVTGYIEPTRTVSDGTTAACNDGGKFPGLKPNRGRHDEDGKQ